MVKDIIGQNLTIKSDLGEFSVGEKGIVISNPNNPNKITICNKGMIVKLEVL